MSSIVADYPSSSSARTHIKEVLDGAAEGKIVTISRDGELAAVVELSKLREYFYKTVSPRTQIEHDNGQVIVFLEGRPFVSEGANLEQALQDLILSLREYAEDWHARLSKAPNHADNWALVQLVNISTDQELLQWLESGGE